jgi:hypothetical protein
MNTVTQVIFISDRGASRLPLSRPRTLLEVDRIVRRAIVARGGDASALVVSLPYGTSTAVVNV